MQKSRTRLIPLALGTGVLCADIALEHWAREALVDPICATEWPCLAMTHNAGLFPGVVPIGAGALAQLLTLVLGTAILWLTWRAVSASGSATRIGYALVAGGFAGNGLDRIGGPVVDYVGVGPVVEGKWIFANLADVAMVAGGIMLTVVFVSGQIRAKAPCRSSRNVSPISWLADANLLALAGRAPSSRFDVVSATPSASLGPCDPLSRHIDARSYRKSVKHCG